MNVFVELAIVSGPALEFWVESYASAQYVPAPTGGMVTLAVKTPVAFTVAPPVPARMLPRVPTGPNPSATVSPGIHPVPLTVTGVPTGPVVGLLVIVNPDTVNVLSENWRPAVVTAIAEYVPGRMGGTEKLQLQSPNASTPKLPPLHPILTDIPSRLTPNTTWPIVSPAGHPVPATVTGVPTGPVVGVLVIMSAGVTVNVFVELTIVPGPPWGFWVESKASAQYSPATTVGMVKLNAKPPVAFTETPPVTAGMLCRGPTGPTPSETESPGVHPDPSTVTGVPTGPVVGVLVIVNSGVTVNVFVE